MVKIRFLQVTSFYPEYHDRIYAEDPELRYQPYKVQYQRLMDTGLGWSDSWVVALNSTGRFDAVMFCMNTEHAQKQWALENHFVYDPENWMVEIMMEQVRRFHPDVLFGHDYTYFRMHHIQQLRREVPSIKRVIGWDGIGMCDADRFRACDIMLSCNRNIAEYYTAAGLNGYYFPFAFERSILDRIETGVHRYDVSFIGSLTLRKNAHQERLRMLGAVARNFPVHYWLSSFDENPKYLLKNILLEATRGHVRTVADILLLRRINRGRLFGIDMYQHLAYSRITLNCHIHTAFNFGGNIRLWEATGAGACLVTDWKDNMDELFVPDKEVVVYRSIPECIDKIRYLLDHPAEMNAIAEAGQRRTLREYSYEQRISDFLPVLMKML